MGVLLYCNGLCRFAVFCNLVINFKIWVDGGMPKGSKKIAWLGILRQNNNTQWPISFGLSIGWYRTNQAFAGCLPVSLLFDLACCRKHNLEKKEFYHTYRKCPDLTMLSIFWEWNQKKIILVRIVIQLHIYANVRIVVTFHICQALADMHEDMDNDFAFCTYCGETPCIDECEACYHFLCCCVAKLMVDSTACKDCAAWHDENRFEQI